jgi:hypothetical protein
MSNINMIMIDCCDVNINLKDRLIMSIVIEFVNFCSMLLLVVLQIV